MTQQAAPVSLPGLEQLACCQQQLIEALASADRSGVDAAVAEMRLAIAALQRSPPGHNALPAIKAAADQNEVLREALRARLARARAALDALGIHATAYEAHGQLRYHTSR